jgi:hypothetical protein
MSALYVCPYAKWDDLKEFNRAVFGKRIECCAEFEGSKGQLYQHLFNTHQGIQHGAKFVQNINEILPVLLVQLVDCRKPEKN